MARHRGRSQLDSIDEINMTPLIDLTFLLLIIFMITAPLLEYGINVSPPEMNADELPEDNSRIITLDKDGQYVFNETVMDQDDLLLELKSLFMKNPESNILVRADGNQQYKKVIDLMKVIKDAGFKNVSLVTQAEN
jgi:biopolymer transport protein ExbD